MVCEPDICFCLLITFLGLHLPSGDDSVNEQRASLVVPLSTVTTRSTTPVGQNNKAFDRLQLLVSLDTALELIHADRESLKRAETFAGYPGKYGVKVREAIEEIFILLLQATSDRHIAPGFQMYVKSDSVP
jgi:recyclin-1